MVGIFPISFEFPTTDIDNIYSFLSDKLEIEYYSYMDQSKHEIRIFGTEFVEKNKDKFTSIITIDKKSPYNLV